ncbi:MAG: hypothetical protein ACRD0U_05495, partial [Acidimicrobiales bacterium]
MSSYGYDYGSYPPSQPPAQSPPASGPLDQLGDRAARRPEPRLAIALAAVGVALVILGALVWAGEGTIKSAVESYFGEGDDTEKTLGSVLSLLIAASGYALLGVVRTGPAATAGSVAAALGVPLLLVFLSLDFQRRDLPVSIDFVLLVSIAAWLVTYVWVPGGRGRSLHLGLAAGGLWFYLTGKGTGLFDVGELATDSPDATTFGVLSLLFGAGYYAAAIVLDRLDRHGVALPFVITGLIATGAGVAGLADDLTNYGTGILLMILGVVLGGYGAAAGRRFTTGVWAAGFGLGVLLIIGEAVASGDDPSFTAFGVVTMIVGAGLVAAAHFLAPVVGEPGELEPGPST